MPVKYRKNGRKIIYFSAFFMMEDGAGEQVSLKIKRKINFPFVFCSLIRTFHLW
jgi:hypothetical protein